MNFKKTLSVVMITYNSEKFLYKCLNSIKWADEIIILDYNSKDNTKKIAKKFGAKMFQSNSWKGFGLQRQVAQKYANSDYILMLDSDEIVNKVLKKEIIKTLRDPNIKKVYSIKRINLFLGKSIRYGGWGSDKVIRLYSNNNYKYNSLKVHESLNIKNKNITNLKGKIFHFTCENLYKFLIKQMKYSKIWAYENFNKKIHCNIFLIIFRSIISFLKKFFIQRSFLDGKYGFIISIIYAQYNFNKYIILWSLKNKK